MTNIILSILAGIVSCFSSLMDWIKTKQISDFGARSQLAQSLEDEYKDDIKITQIRDESFDRFDRFMHALRLPDDAKFRD